MGILVFQGIQGNLSSITYTACSVLAEYRACHVSICTVGMTAAAPCAGDRGGMNPLHLRRLIRIYWGPRSFYRLHTFGS